MYKSLKCFGGLSWETIIAENMKSTCIGDLTIGIQTQLCNIYGNVQPVFMQMPPDTPIETSFPLRGYHLNPKT